MKKIIFLLVFIPTLFVQVSSARSIRNTAPASALLALYYDIKDALVSGDPNAASAKAAEFVKTLKTLDAGALPEASSEALLKDAAHISKSGDIKTQREHFKTFSETMYTLAKTSKLSEAPVYKAYCPMKRASWLSRSAAIKNPYYGAGMLSCGVVTETIK